MTRELRDARLLERLRDDLRNRRGSLPIRLPLRLILSGRVRFPRPFLFTGSLFSLRPGGIPRKLLALTGSANTPYWSPSPDFDADLYLEKYSDVTGNAWIHYQTIGYSQLRIPNKHVNPLLLETRYKSDAYHSGVDSYLANTR